jgi:plasmid maintenance system antidote protein VapI
MAAKKLAPIHPGEVLLEEFLGKRFQYSLGRVSTVT